MSAEIQAARSKIFWYALGLRVAVAVTLHFTVPEELFAPDQVAYHIFGERLSRYWTGDLLVFPGFPAGPTGYYYVVAALYTVFGAWPLVVKLANCVVGAVTILLVYDLALKVTGSNAAAFRAARYTAYFPSLILWSTLNIRDCWVVLLIVLVCREAMVLQEAFSMRALLRLAVSVWAITQFRDYILFMVTLPMLITFLVRRRAHLARNVLFGMIAAVVVIYVDQAAGQGRRMRTIDLEQLNTLRQWSSSSMAAQSGFAAEADISTPAKALAFLPIGLAYFMLAPFPWTVTGVRQIITLPEMLFFYTLIPPLIRGVVALLRRRLADTLMVVLITIGVTLGYAIGQGNVGTIYRHRAQVLPFYLMFAAMGVELRRRTAYPSVAPTVPVLVRGEARPA